MCYWFHSFENNINELKWEKKMVKNGKFCLDDIECKEARYRVQYLLAHPELDKVSHVLYEAALQKYQHMFDADEHQHKRLFSDDKFDKK